MPKIDHIKTDFILDMLPQLNNAEKMLIAETIIQKQMNNTTFPNVSTEACKAYMEKKYGKNSNFIKLEP